ncbi:macro domain-containing protein [Chitinophaga sp. Cy-1792]|uniref:macro domain-containing protein n=1 Tax=Chitinophaga sp. Cy-1792 TaxID=2608339 RepID=UPI00141DB05F|nr:macro domain-containing protein [Chitinophaga sp. Cy-1792]NIG53414.1 Appr-1-p processing protein [Chitinophaga sp. Cy-1792]
MKLILADLEPRLVAAWRSFFDTIPDVTIIEGDITALTVDAVVSPANSFGFMDGGLDYALSERLGWDLEKRLQALIKALPEGELLVGQSLVLETDDDKIPFLISAPTMRVPTNFNIDTSINAYLAMKAALLAARRHPDITSVAIPGFCTGVGRMQPIIAAKQMHMAYEEVMLGKKMDFSTFSEAQQHHWKINPQGMIWTH